MPPKELGCDEDHKSGSGEGKRVSEVGLLSMEEDDRNRAPRIPLKNRNQPNWKQKLRDKCLKRVQADRNRLLLKIRSAPPSPLTEKEVMDFTFRDIMSDELKKIKDLPTSVSVGNDVIWEYDGVPKNSEPSESEWEEIMIEMQRIFYEDLRSEETKREQADYKETWAEEKDYLAEVAFDQLCLNNNEVCKKEVWCPICKRGELREDHHVIYCTQCKLQLYRGNEVNLDILRVRLAEAHIVHLDRGCRLAPKFCMETRFDLTALYIQCEACNTFEIVS